MEPVNLQEELLLEAHEPDPVVDELATADLRQIARELEKEEVRDLVIRYYQVQKTRIAQSNRTKALLKAGKSAKLSAWLAGQYKLQERVIQRVMDYWTDRFTAASWAKAQVGIGPVLAAGLVAHVNVHRQTTPSKLWRFAGLDPTVSWYKGQLRPWNARLKTVCYLAGESFVTWRKKPKCFYGHLYQFRKDLEWQRNLAGQYSAQALGLASKFDKKTESYQWYSGAFKGVEQTDKGPKGIPAEDGEGIPMLPPGQIHARARRWAVKIFLVHLWMMAYVEEFGKQPPMPWVIEHGGHRDFIPIPGVDFSLDEYAARGNPSHPIESAILLARKA